MALATLDGALLLLLALLLPLQLLSLHFRLAGSPSGRRLRTIRSMALFASTPILMSAIFALSDFDSSKRADSTVSQLDELNLKVAQLELIIEEKGEALSSKSLQLERYDKLVNEMEQKIQFLQKTLGNIKESSIRSTHPTERLHAMEEEVKLSWEELRKNNFNNHILESKTYDMEEKLEAVAAEVEKLESIVTEQWIQIRQLEQSLHMTKIMRSRVDRKRRQLRKCTIVKFINSIHSHFHPYSLDLPDSTFLGSSMSSSWISHTVDRLKSSMQAAQKWHYQLQDSVKSFMEKNEIFGVIANKEVVFFVASAMIILPVMLAWVLCFSCFGHQCEECRYFCYHQLIT